MLNHFFRSDIEKAEPTFCHIYIVHYKPNVFEQNDKIMHYYRRANKKKHCDSPSNHSAKLQHNQLTNI